MLVLDHPALVLKRRQPVRVRDDGKVDPDWVQEQLAAMARVPVPTIYRRALDRWRRSLRSSEHTTTWTGRCDGRLLVGVGAATVLETGVALHHTYGVPYVPGSALKGLCAHYAAEVIGREDPAWQLPPSTNDGDRGWAHGLVFGTTERMGLITFLDGWLVPGEGSALVGDVLTPHHPDYYGGGDRLEWPADWDDPVPVSFLSVRGTFLFAVESEVERIEEPDRKGDELADKVTDLREEVVTRIAKSALMEWGIGAKTTAGYGRMLPVE